MQMRTILVSEPVWQAIANRGKFGETEDDVLRREFELPLNSNRSIASSALSRSRGASSRVDGGPRKQLATRRMSAYVGNNQLHISFQGGASKSWPLPLKTDKATIRDVRDKAVAFALENDASNGQKYAVMKALTDSGFHLTK
jgi:hypothetical protein